MQITNAGMIQKTIKSFTIHYVDIPSRPDIDRIIVVPLRTIFLNLNTGPRANVTRLVLDLDEHVPRFVYPNSPKG